MRIQISKRFFELDRNRSSVVAKNISLLYNFNMNMSEDAKVSSFTKYK